ncbi:hypothetical protein CRENBAI_007585 [Crenichthys baileyi]|uniref:Uncharacterized protein n=1 Tax=Crenichthys baileyi TaxID=28760 RepID=A0AAV9SLR2_9TELE
MGVDSKGNAPPQLPRTGWLEGDNPVPVGTTGTAGKRTEGRPRQGGWANSTGSSANMCAGFKRSYTWPDSVSTCNTFLERGILQASAGNNLMLTLYR